MVDCWMYDELLETVAGFPAQIHQEEGDTITMPEIWTCVADREVGTWVGYHVSLF